MAPTPAIARSPLAHGVHLPTSIDSPIAAAAEETYIHVNGETPVRIVKTVKEAQATVEVLKQLPSHMFHACDTEVAGLDMDKSPLGQGRVICVSIYSGPTVDFGAGPGTALWVDTTDLAVLEVFKPWLEDESALKVAELPGGITAIECKRGA